MPPAHVNMLSYPPHGNWKGLNLSLSSEIVNKKCITGEGHGHFSTWKQSWKWLTKLFYLCPLLIYLRDTFQIFFVIFSFLLYWFLLDSLVGSSHGTQMSKCPKGCVCLHMFWVMGFLALPQVDNIILLLIIGDGIKKIWGEIVDEIW